jgi:probable HAF family extracellular repeat protein
MDHPRGVYFHSNGRTTQLDTTGSVAMNEAGRIVGSSAEGGYRAYRISGDTVVDEGRIEHPSLINPEAMANDGRVLQQQFVYRDGEITDIEPSVRQLGGFAAMSEDMNNAGQVVGTFLRSPLPGPDRNVRLGAFLYRDGQIEDLGRFAPPGADGFAPGAINDSGQIVGEYTMQPTPHPDSDPGRRHSFLLDDGRLTELGTLGGDTHAADINDLGQVVGWSSLLGEGDYGGRRAFLYQDGEMIDLNDLLPPETSWTLYEATAINDRGQILGSMADGDVARPFLLSPTTVPEPAPVLVLGAAIALWGRSRRRSRGQV